MYSLSFSGKHKLTAEYMSALLEFLMHKTAKPTEYKTNIYAITYDVINNRITYK